MGIEPTLSDWKSEVIAIILTPHASGLVIDRCSTGYSPWARDGVMTPLNALPELANALSGGT